MKVIDNIKILGIIILAFLLVSGCSDDPASSNGNDNGNGNGDEITIFDYSDDFEANEDGVLSDREWIEGFSYLGAQTDSFTVISAANQIGAINMTFTPGVTPNAYWMLPAMPTNEIMDYRTKMTTNLGSDEGQARWSILWLGVRHDGEYGGEETTYAVALRGANSDESQLQLVRRNLGEETLLAENMTFSTDQGIEFDTPVELELQAVTEGDTVVLNVWATVNGTRTHVLEYEDADANRITSGLPAFGQSINFGRIHAASVLEVE